MIHVTVKLFPPFSKNLFQKKVFELPDNATTTDLMRMIALPEDRAYTMIVNAKFIADEKVLNEGDAVSVLPVISGG